MKNEKEKYKYNHLPFLVTCFFVILKFAEKFSFVNSKQTKIVKKKYKFSTVLTPHMKRSPRYITTTRRIGHINALHKIL